MVHFVDSARKPFTCFCEGARGLGDHSNLITEADLFFYERLRLTFAAAKTAGEINVANVHWARVRSFQTASVLSLLRRPKFDFAHFPYWRKVRYPPVPARLYSSLFLARLG